MAAGADARSRSVTITDTGRVKRAEGQRNWRAAQEGINTLLGVQRVVALHLLLDESLETLSTLTAGVSDE